MSREISPEDKFMETFYPDESLMVRAARRAKICNHCKNSEVRSQEAQQAKCAQCWVPTTSRIIEEE
jgi:uncharacterized paraquat-inducible protein A